MIEKKFTFRVETLRGEGEEMLSEVCFGGGRLREGQIGTRDKEFFFTVNGEEELYQVLLGMKVAVERFQANADKERVREVMKPHDAERLLGSEKPAVVVLKKPRKEKKDATTVGDSADPSADQPAGDSGSAERHRPPLEKATRKRPNR